MRIMNRNGVGRLTILAGLLACTVGGVLGCGKPSAQETAITTDVEKIKTALASAPTTDQQFTDTIEKIFSAEKDIDAVEPGTIQSSSARETEDQVPQLEDFMKAVAKHNPQIMSAYFSNPLAPLTGDRYQTPAVQTGFEVRGIIHCIMYSRDLLQSKSGAGQESAAEMEQYMQSLGFSGLLHEKS
jgi:hypothetical protein